MSTPLLPEVIPEIDANPVSFFGRSGVGEVGHGLELHAPSPFTSVYAKFKMTILEFAVLQYQRVEC